MSTASSVCGIANPGGTPCPKSKGHEGGHDPAAYGPAAKEETPPERVRFMRIDTMTWPTVDNDLAWRLRYSQNSISVKDKFYLASLMEAYSELINCGREKRETVCRAIRGRTE